jgi:DNA-binding NtrC family response regulator
MLNELNVIVVEDEVLIALDVSMTLEEHGATVSGPFAALRPALRAAFEDRIDAAVLDVDIAGSDVFPLADALHARGVPMIFHTGRHDAATLRRRYGPGTVVVSKGMPVEHLVQGLAGMTGPRAAGAASTG